MDEKAMLQEEINNLKIKQLELKQQLMEIELKERLSSSKRIDIASKITNKHLLDYIFPYYDNLMDCVHTRAPTGKVVLRRRHGNTPNDFSKIRDLAKMITNYTEFSRRSDNYIMQKCIKRNLQQLDNTELDYVKKCTEEIIDVLYKYKKLCEKHQGNDYSEFVIESENDDGKF